MALLESSVIPQIDPLDNAGWFDPSDVHTEFSASPPLAKRYPPAINTLVAMVIEKSARIARPPDFHGRGFANLLGNHFMSKIYEDQEIPFRMYRRTIRARLASTRG